MTSTGPIGPRPPPRPPRLAPADWKHNTTTFKGAGRVWCGHREKKPLDLATERYAKSNNPATWRDYRDAAAFYERTQGSPVAGVGVMLYRQAFGGKGLLCLDFDDALDEQGKLRAWAQPLVQPFVGTTYIERSLGGRGVHVFLLGDFPEGCTRNQATVSFSCSEAPKAKLEAFREPHFVTLSGDVLFASMVLGEASEALLAVLEESGALLKLISPTAPAEGTPAGAVDLAELPRALEALHAINPDVDRETWLAVGMALHQAFGPKGWEAWSEWSSGGAKYAGPGDCGKVWASFRQTSGGITLGTLFHHAKAAGWPGTRPSELSAAKEFREFAESGDGRGISADKGNREPSIADEWVFVREQDKYMSVASRGLLTRTALNAALQEESDCQRLVVDMPTGRGGMQAVPVKRAAHFINRESRHSDNVVWYPGAPLLSPWQGRTCANLFGNRPPQDVWRG